MSEVISRYNTAAGTAFNITRWPDESSRTAMRSRKGGNLEFLRRILGHSSILTTQKCLRSLGVADLQAVHNNLSMLSATR